MSEFKNQHKFEKRAEESKRIKLKYPDRCPIIVEKDPKSDIKSIDKNKYLTPLDLTLGQFCHVVRKRVNIDSTKAIFLFINNTLPCHSTLISNLYKEHADKDGFLYITYSGESTFG